VSQRQHHDHRRKDDAPEFREAAPGMGSIASMIGTKNLLIIIITMPFVFLVVVMAIIALFGRPGEETAAASGAVRSTPVAEVEEAAPAIEGQRVVLPTPAAASEVSPAIVLPEGAEAGALSLDGDRLAVRIDGPDGAQIVIYDLNTEEVVKTIPLTTAQEN